MEDSDKDRREFLAKCGRFAVITPPAMTVLMSTSLTSDAIAKSGHGYDKPGHHDHGHHYGRDK